MCDQVKSTGNNKYYDIDILNLNILFHFKIKM